MDPTLLAALQKLLLAQRNAREVGEEIPRKSIEAFISRETGGKFGYEDLAPLLEASGSNMLRSVMNGATANLADNAIGMFSPAQADESRLRSDYYKLAHPGRDLFGGLLGGLVSGKALAGLIGGAGEAQTITQAAKTGAKSGAAYGAADAYGRADDKEFPDKLVDAGKGAGLGAILGAGISGAASGVGALFSPARHAAGRIASAIEKDGGLAALQARVREMVANGRGDAVTLADLGPHLRQALDFAANASDNVLIPTAELLEARTAERASRLLSDARQGFTASGLGEPNAALRAEQLRANTQKVGREAYGAVEQQQTQTPQIAGMPLDKPLIRQLWEKAKLAGNISTRGPLDDLIDKLAASNPGVPRAQLADDAATLTQLKAKAAGVPLPSMDRPPTVSDLMQLRRGLSGRIDEAFAPGKSNGAMGEALKEMRDHVDNVLQTHAPFREANAAYTAANDLERALESGHDWWMKADKRELERAVAGLRNQPGAIDEFRHGIASGLVEKLQAVGQNRDAARELMQASADLDAKLEVIFGNKQTFNTFMNRVKAERELGRLGTTIGGSVTARRISNAGFDPEHLGLDLAVHGPGLAKSMALSMARAAMTKRSAELMGPKLLTQGAPNIDALIASLGQHAPIAGAGSTMMAPMGLMSLFGH